MTGRSPVQQLDEPSLVVDAGRRDVQVLRPLHAQHLRYLPRRVLHAVAEADHVEAVVEGGPGVHRHRVRVVDEERPGLGHLLGVPAEVQHLGDVPLGVHDAPGADGVADALVDAVLERYVDVQREGLQPADPGAVDDVVRVGERLAPVGGRRHGGRQLVVANVLLAELGDKVQVPLGDVGEGEVGVLELWHRQDVAEELPGETDAARADERDLHGVPPTHSRGVGKAPSGPASAPPPATARPPGQPATSASPRETSARLRGGRGTPGEAGTPG